LSTHPIWGLYYEVATRVFILVFLVKGNMGAPLYKIAGRLKPLQTMLINYAQ